MRYVERLRGQRMIVAPKRARAPACLAALLQLGWRNSKLKTEISNLKTQNSKLKTEISKLKTQNSAFFAALLQLEWRYNSKLKSQNSELRTQNSELRTQNSELKTQNSKLKTQNWNVERYCNECVITVSTSFNLIWQNLNGENFISNSDSAAEWAQVSTWSAP